MGATRRRIRADETFVRRMDRGLIVTELMGQGVNSVTGDYTRDHQQVARSSSPRREAPSPRRRSSCSS